MKLTTLLLAAAMRQVEIITRRGLATVVPTLRNIALGLACLLLALVLFGLTLCFIGVGIFLRLGEVEGNWIEAAFWITIGSLIVEFFLLTLGLSLMRPPRKG